ncbi:MAG TPA: GatB/YqeY domain-containing protein [Acetobacteraceae bacterium]|nr:GatB/YqeY domain-containing protein [Acetobacteraceae bacterium]
MSIRERLTEEMKAAMRAGDALRVSTLRMAMARLKETDIAARPKGVDKVPDAEIVPMLRSMVKSRRESAAMYRQGNRPELAEKEEAEVAILEEYLPQSLEGAALDQAVADAIKESGAAGVKDMGKVMAALKARHGAALDMAASAAVKAQLAG